ncbi:hypothetical protein EB796_015820 [Bugula neritina]|uniref:C-type lectin domain-containing protein n=1 Tax=Bugula neritina TaxID=10212 RepID=A0A7J7JJ82_BUGNE|nr:hypothetical protein EB796_015820 [Bugula neritina]
MAIFVLTISFLATICGVTSQSLNGTTVSTESPQTMTEEFCQNEYCYSMWAFKDSLTRTEASQFCRSRGETLGTIPNKEVEMTLLSQLTEDGGDSHVGLSLVLADSWKWFHANGWWENVAPRDREGTGSCLLVVRSELYSVSCAHQLSYICEFEDAPLPSDCDVARQKFGMSWVCANSQKLDWFEAATDCHQRGGNLLVINSEYKKNMTAIMLQRESSYFWSAGTKVMFLWDGEGASFIHPSDLVWSKDNPDLIRGWYCVALSGLYQGLTTKPCNFRSHSAICSKVNPNKDGSAHSESPPIDVDLHTGDSLSATTTAKSAVIVGSTDSPRTSSTESTVSSTSPSISSSTNSALNISLPNVTPDSLATIRGTEASTILSSATTSSIIKTTRSSLSVSTTTNKMSAVYPTTKGKRYMPTGLDEPMGSEKGTSIYVHHSHSYTGINVRQYKAVLICAYILAALVIFGIVLIVIMLVRRRQKKKQPKFYDPVEEKRLYKTLGNGTLGRQRSSHPTEEWEKVVTENGGSMVEMREKNEMDEIDIIHNVPLDPRASIEQPLYVPTQSQVVTLQRAKSHDSQNSIASSEVNTFTLDRRSNASSVSTRVPPAVPPKMKPILKPESVSDADDVPFPPPPPLETLPALPPPPPPKKRPPKRIRKRAPDPYIHRLIKTEHCHVAAPHPLSRRILLFRDNSVLTHQHTRRTVTAVWRWVWAVPTFLLALIRHTG